MKLLVFALCATILWSLVNVIDKFVVNIDNQNNYWGILNVSTLSLAPLFFILKAYFDIHIPNDYFVFIIYLLVGVSYFLAVYFYLKSLYLAEATSVSILLKLSSIFILVGEIAFLGGSFKITELIGMFFLILSSLIISINSVTNFSLDKSLWLMLVSGVFFGIRSLLSDYIVSGEPIRLYVWSIIGALLAVVIVLILNSKARIDTIDILRRYSKRQIFLISLSKNLSGIGILTYTMALDLGSVSIVSFITSTQPIFVVILVTIITLFMGVAKDEFNRDYSLHNTIKTIVSIILAVIGVMFISFLF